MAPVGKLALALLGYLPLAHCSEISLGTGISWRQQLYLSDHLPNWGIHAMAYEWFEMPQSLLLRKCIIQYWIVKDGVEI
jgi:hypothetical protein